MWGAGLRSPPRKFAAKMVQSGAEARYKDLAVWFGRPETPCYRFDPHTYPQGSFRPGTVVSGEEYDLDFGCRDFLCLQRSERCGRGTCLLCPGQYSGTAIEAGHVRGCPLVQGRKGISSSWHIIRHAGASAITFPHRGPPANIQFIFRSAK